MKLTINIPKTLLNNIKSLTQCNQTYEAINRALIQWINSKKFKGQERLWKNREIDKKIIRKKAWGKSINEK